MKRVELLNEVGDVLELDVVVRRNDQVQTVGHSEDDRDEDEDEWGVVVEDRQIVTLFDVPHDWQASALILFETWSLLWQDQQ